MKHTLKTFFWALAVLGLLAACEENTVLPDFETIGTSTSTIASISVSNSSPAAGEAITLTLYYINVAEDPASQIEIQNRIGSADFTTVTTLDESGAPTAAEITRTVEWTVPAGLASGTRIDIDMLLSTQRDFPQRERASVTVQ